MLVVGFDGGAKLWGHSDSTKLRMAVAHPEVSKIRDLDVQTGWQRRDSFQRIRVLEEHTRPQAVDQKAIAFLAGLLRGGYLRGIVATDPCRALFRTLRDQYGFQPHLFNCARETLNWLRMAESSVRTGDLVFVDGAETLLQGFEPTHTNLSGDGLTEVLKALKQCLRACDLTFCWGWCDINRNFTDIWEGLGETLYLWGTYTQSLAMRPPPSVNAFIVTDGSDGDVANTDILHRLSDLLFPAEPSSDAHLGAPAVAGARAVTSVRFGLGVDEVNEEIIGGTPTCLLWHEDTLDGIVEASREHLMVVVGAEGGLVTSRLARRTLRRLQNMGRACIYRPCAGPESLHALSRTLQTLSREFCVIAEIGGDARFGEPTRREAMALWFNQWLEHLRNSRARFLIFAPVGWANDALQASLPRSEVDFCSLLGDNCVQPRQVARWLQTAPGLPAENIQAADSDGYGRLAEYMVEQAGKMPSGSKGEAADRFHQILDLWYAEACGAGVEGAQESAVPIVEQLKRIWDQLLACHEEEGLPTDVRIDIVRKRPPRPSRGKRPAQPTLTVDWPFKAQKRQKPTEGT